MEMRHIKKSERAKKPLSKAQARKRSQRLQRALRWAIQIAFFFSAPGVFSAAFNGVKYIARQIGQLQAIEPTSFLILLAGVCAFTVVFGRFFCGYACAFGTLGDALYTLAAPLRSWVSARWSAYRSAARQHATTRHAPRQQSGYGAHAEKRKSGIKSGVAHALPALKVVVLGVIVGLCVCGTYDSAWSPWTAFAAFTSASFEGVSRVAFVLLAAIAVGMACVERFFCRFLCPLGAVFSLLPQLPATQFKREAARCASHCGRCCKACPVHRFPQGDSLDAGECIACGQCALACPLDNVAIMRLRALEGQGSVRQLDSRPTQDQRDAQGQEVTPGQKGAQDQLGAQSKKGVQSQEQNAPGTENNRKRRFSPGRLCTAIKGTHPAWVIVRAVGLFALLYFLGGVR